MNSHLTCKVCLEAIQTSPNDPSITQYKQLTELKALSDKLISSPANSSNAVSRNQFLENEIARL
jgi:hypothetical protein